MKRTSVLQKCFRMKSTMPSFLLFFIITVFSLIFSEVAYSQGNLLITPRRVVFEGTKKSQEINLANTGTDTSRYIVSIVQYRMNEDGTFVEITEPDPGQKFADKYLRFFPRTVTLAPNEAQVVKMQVTKTNELEPGEYRSHIYFRAVPREKALGEIEKPKDTTAISVKLTPVFGITIPVIIRVGDPDAKVTLSDLAVDLQNDTLPRLNLTFNRTGSMSVYGDLSVTYTSPDGKQTEVGMVKGIAVYTPNVLRRFRVDMKIAEGIDYRNGKLHIDFNSQTDVKSSKLAEADLILK